MPDELECLIGRRRRTGQEEVHSGDQRLEPDMYYNEQVEH